MKATSKETESSIPLRPTIGHRGKLLAVNFISLYFFWHIFQGLLSSPSKKERAILIIPSIMFFVLSTYCLFCGIQGFRNGRLELNDGALVIKRDGTSTKLPYEKISTVALTKIMLGKSFIRAVLLETKTYDRIYIYDHYEETAEDIFFFLKTSLTEKRPSIKFYVKPGVSF